MIHHLLFFLFSYISVALATFSETYEYLISQDDRQKEKLLWEKKDLAPFDELILSWNGERSLFSKYAFCVSLHQNGEWSPWLYYGDWGNCGQMLCVESPDDSFAETNRGFVRPKRGFCDGFRIQVHAPDTERLSKMDTLWASVSNLSSFTLSESPTPSNFESVLLENVPRHSIYPFRLPRYLDMSMIASLLSAIQYLGKTEIDIEDFSRYTMDGDFESYDFWALQAAEAFHRLKGKFWVHIERLADFSAIHAYLMKGLPVVVDILGTPLGGIPVPPYRRHTLCIIGYNKETNTVLCLDPAFPSKNSTFVAYSLPEFIKVWAKRHQIACIFEPKKLGRNDLNIKGMNQ